MLLARRGCSIEAVRCMYRVWDQPAGFTAIMWQQHQNKYMCVREYIHQSAAGRAERLHDQRIDVPALCHSGHVSTFQSHAALAGLAYVSRDLA